MLTKIEIKNFKVFDDVEIELENPVVFIGPNNSGKTTVLQALALWEVGLKKWIEKRGGKSAPGKRPGVTINRLELISLPVPIAKALWHNLVVRDVSYKDGKQQTKNVFLTILVEGINGGDKWKCGLDFYYSNDQSFYCRPMAIKDGRMPVPSKAGKIRIAFLPPMSGLATVERRIDSGAINVLIGEGRTALHPDGDPRKNDTEKWQRLVEYMKTLFGIELLEPQYIEARGEITMSYEDVSGAKLPLSSAGRGMQQTLLLLSYMFANRGSIVLIDEPDAHLEILRQRQIYQVIIEVANEQGTQLIIATHSEVVFNEAAGKDKVVAFVGKPHVITDKGSQVLKSLNAIGWEQYSQAEQQKWVLYLEGSTDLAILQAFAKKLDHPVLEHLQRPFVNYISNQPQKARDHFYALREAVPDLLGIALLDQLDKEIPECPGLEWLMWERNEIESYLCFPKVLLRFARGKVEGNLFAEPQVKEMEKIIKGRIPSDAYDNLDDKWWKTTKITDDFLDIVFERYSKEIGTPILRKGQYYRLVDYLELEEILPEVEDKLDTILNVAESRKSV